MEMRQIPLTSWIWPEEWTHADTAAPKIVYFRRELTLDRAVSSFKVEVSADSRYRLLVNGQSVSVGPCKGDGVVWYKETVELKDFLREGANVIAAIVLRYPTDKRYNHSVWRTQTPGFFLEGEIRYADGANEAFRADGAFKSKISRDIEIVREGGFQSFLFVNEIARGDAALSGWTDAGYDDATWGGVKAYSRFELSGAVSPASATERPIPPLYEIPKAFAGVMAVRASAHEKNVWEGFASGTRAVTIPSNSTEIVELNAEYLTTGYLNLCFAGGAGATVEILCSEAYAQPRKEGERHGKKGDRTDSIHGELEGYADVYTVDGFGTQTIPEMYEPFWFRAFRFIKLTVKTGDAPLTLHSIGYRETGYPLEVKTQARASDESLAPVWDISLNSLRRCMHETYEDCPFYEQLQYAMDTRSQILFTYALSMDDRLARKTIDEFHRARRPDGMINCCYPSYGPNIIPGFSIYYIMMIHDHMMYFGDKSLVRRYLPTVDGILEFFGRALDARGLVEKIGGPLGRNRYWSYIDWATDWGKTMGVPDAILEGPITMESLLYVSGLEYAAELAEYVGRAGQGAEYRARAEALKAAINEHCVGKNGLYQDGPGVEKYSQHCQVWAVLTGCAPEGEAKRLMEAALNDKSLAQCTVSFAFYFFRALEKVGMYERTKTLWEPWREMIRNHLTTCVESNTDPRSECHAWGSILLYELPAVILGVRPAKPGYAAARVAPNLGYLDWAEGTVATPKGMLSVSCRKTEIGMDVKIDAPEGLDIVR